VSQAGERTADLLPRQSSHMIRLEQLQRARELELAGHEAAQSNLRRCIPLGELFQELLVDLAEQSATCKGKKTNTCKLVSQCSSDLLANNKGA
jgi:hypothetical protein